MMQRLVGGNLNLPTPAPTEPRPVHPELPIPKSHDAPLMTVPPDRTPRPA
jgi:hypothetical protein